MKKYRLFLGVFLFLFSCGHLEAEPTKDLTPQYTNLFAIEDLDGGLKRVLDGDGQEFILVPRTLGNVPAQYAGKTIIRTPLKRGVFLASTFVGSLYSAGNDHTNWDNIPPVKERLEDGRIVEVGRGMAPPDFERMAFLRPEVVFLSTSGHASQGTKEKLRELGLNYVVVNSFLEANYMARMEWLRLLLTFFNEDDLALKVMAEAEKNTAEVKAKLKNSPKPKVLFASIYNGLISAVPPSHWLGSLIADAGGDSVVADLGGGTFLNISPEEFIIRANEADIIVYTSIPSFVPNKRDLFKKLPLMQAVPAVQTGKLWQYSDSFWLGADRAPQMLTDLAAIFHPALYPGHLFTFFRQVPE